MKRNILILLFGLTQGCVFAQCPESGLKIQSSECEDPRGLMVSSTSCKEMKIKWVGIKDGQYAVTATLAENNERGVKTVRVYDLANDNGNCTATITVEEAANVNWSVQSVCNIKGAKVYSAPVAGTETYIPVCKADRRTEPVKGFAVYPNPTKGLLTVDYSGNTEKNIVLNVYDMSGKKVFTQNQASLSGNNNQFKLNLRELVPGAYTLEMLNGGETKQTKFVVVRE